MDNDTKMLKEMGNKLVLLQVKFKMSDIDDRAEIRPELENLLEEFAKYRTLLLMNGVITTDADLAEMADIRDAIDAAAGKQSLLLAIARTVAFIALRV